MKQEDLKRLKEILKKQLDWYKENIEDEDYLYDMAYEQFSDLRRADFKDILKILLESE